MGEVKAMTLVVFSRHTVQALLGHGLGGNVQSAALAKDFRHLVGLFAFKEQHALEGFGLFQRFEDRVNAKEKSPF